VPRILVVNDDGIDSEGIRVLARALQALGEVTVVAPDGDRSGTSHSISVHSAVRAQASPEDGLARFACSGTPADCVLLGVNELCGGRPDLVVSGINRGANLADDVNYSGTVAAAGGSRAGRSHRGVRGEEAARRVGLRCNQPTYF